MTAISDDMAAIDGMTFSSSYFYNAEIADQYYNPADGSHGGTAQNFSPTALAGTIHTTDSSEGLFTLGGQLFQLQGAGADSQSLVFRLITTDILSSEVYYVLSNTGAPPAGAIAYNSSDPYSAPNPTCYAAGTRISTVTGDAAIETLAIGDVIRLADGGTAPVKWMGKRHLRCSASPWKRDVLPILIERHAIDLFVPSQDLMVSPGHGIQVDHNLLIQAEYLVNGDTIRQVEVEAIMYWHLELENHSIIIANGTPAESYIDVGNRADFDNSGAVENLHPHFKTSQLDKYCMPVAQDEAVREAYRRKFAERAAALRAALNDAA